MIFVTGTKRSGTSMWMQILIEAGFPFIGEAYPKNWIHSIKDANSEGFYESPLRRGVYYATNPDPKTGSYYHHTQTERHAIKVFVPGLLRSDMAFIHRVVGTIRPWREYTTSLRRLYAMEDEFLSEQPKKANAPLPPLELALLQRGNLHPALEWWRENYDLIRNFATRRFAFNLVSYQKLLSEPDKVIPPVIQWCGGGDIEKAVAVVKPKLNTQKNPIIADSPLSTAQETLFDEIHDHFFRQIPLSAAFIQQLNQTDKELSPLIKETRLKDQREFRKALRGTGMSEKEMEQFTEEQQEAGREI